MNWMVLKLKYKGKIDWFKFQEDMDEIRTFIKAWGFSTAWKLNEDNTVSIAVFAENFPLTMVSSIKDKYPSIDITVNNSPEATAEFHTEMFDYLY